MMLLNVSVAYLCFQSLKKKTHLAGDFISLNNHVRKESKHLLMMTGR